MLLWVADLMRRSSRGRTSELTQRLLGAGKEEKYDGRDGESARENDTAVVDVADSGKLGRKQRFKLLLFSEAFRNRPNGRIVLTESHPERLIRSRVSLSLQFRRYHSRATSGRGEPGSSTPWRLMYCGNEAYHCQCICSTVSTGVKLSLVIEVQPSSKFT